MEFQFTSVLQVVALGVMMAVGWMIRHCWKRYENALIRVEKIRREAQGKQLSELKTLVAELHSDLLRLRNDHDAMKSFLSQWAKTLTHDFSAQLKLNQNDVDELRTALNSLVEFFGAAKNNEKSTGIMVGKDMVLIHRKEQK